MSSRLLRTAMAAALFSAIPLTSVDGVSQPPTTDKAVAAKTGASPAALTTTQAAHLANLKAHGTTEIQRRLSNLTAALTKLSATTKLTAADKTALTNQINSEISSLTALKTKLAADTDLTTARADVQNIVSDYRVYVLLLPKTRLIATADSFSTVETQFNTLANLLQAKIDSTKKAGKDVTALQASLNDLDAKLTDARTKSSSVIAPLLALQPGDYNSNHAVLVNYRNTLRAADTDLTTARDDAKSIISGLKNPAKASASPTASPAK